jgi:hypothetical protein
VSILGAWGIFQPAFLLYDVRGEVVPSTAARTHPEYPLDAGPYRPENHPARDNRHAWFLAETMPHEGGATP